MKKRLTPNQAAWNKEFKRIQRFIKNASKRGFTFEIEKPSRITKKQLEKIRSLKPKELYKQASYIIPETGEEVTGTEGRFYERSQAQLRLKSKYNPPNEINLVLKSVLQQINDWRPDASMRGWLREKKVLDRNELDDMMAAFILSRGENEAALILQQNAERVNQSIFTILNGSNDDSVKIAFTEFATIINGGRPLSKSDSENMTNYTEYYV